MRKRVLDSLAASLLVLALSTPALAQNFVAVADSTNPIVTANVSGTYTGAAWVDVDDDGFLDLFICRKKPIYRNLGNGNFELKTNAVVGQGQANGTTWADYDNDGDLDCYTSGNVTPTQNGSNLFRNDGDFAFARIQTGDIGEALDNSAWGCAWADVDNDAYTDLVLAAANGFGGVSHENRFFYNNGDGTFARVDSTVITDSLDAHTIATWSDYDLDGDMDLFIGSGEISVLSPDNLFRNMLTENGSWGFERITTAPIATDLLDGQVWNWIDYDNDGDLDAYQTNYNTPLTNKLYRNDGGTYVTMTEPDVGTIVSATGAALANNWADFDNDGDLDCLVTNDGGAKNQYFHNDGDGTFTQDFSMAPVLGAGPHYGATAGDYDNDGDLDLYVHGTNLSKALYRNDLANGNAWLNIKLVGAGAPGGSNMAAIGAKVRAKAAIDGSPMWQFREVLAQNSFNTMNMLNVHFGLGDATMVDSLEIQWPAGGTMHLVDIPVNRFLKLEEGNNPTGVGVSSAATASGLRSAVPNPFVSSTRIDYDLGGAGLVSLRIYDVSGRLVRTLVDGVRPAGRHDAEWNGRDEAGSPVGAGVYFSRLETAASGIAGSRKIVLAR